MHVLAKSPEGVPAACCLTATGDVGPRPHRPRDLRRQASAQPLQSKFRRVETS